jgi:zinc transport system substrate-binding protein
MRNFLMLWSLTLLLAGCADEPGAGTPKGQAANAVPSVYTVNYPLAWMAGELSGDLVAVSFPAPAGEDPAFWEPDVDTILQYQQADLVLLNGANYASWVAKVSLPSGTLVDTSASYRDRLITLKSGPSHSHGPGEEHSHGDLA